MAFSKAFFVYLVQGRIISFYHCKYNLCSKNGKQPDQVANRKLNLVPMEACPFGCFLREMSLFVHFYGKIILLPMKKMFLISMSNANRYRKHFAI